MNAKFDTIPLSKTTKFIVDNRGKTAPTENSGIPLIATNCINNSDLYPRYERLRYVSQDTYDNWFRAHPKPGDIILTLKGSQNGAVCLTPEPVEFAIAQDMVALRADEKVIDNNFLFAALRSPDVQSQIKNLDVSGVIPHLKKADFDKLELPYPSRPLQEAIGSYYLNLSRKIDLLHRQNKTLEALAETLFRQWFAEEAGDWKDGTLGDALELNYGKALKNEIRTGSGYPVIGSSGVVGYHVDYLVESPGIVIGRKGTLGKVTYLFDNFFPIDTTYYIKSKRDTTNLFYEYFLLKTLHFENSDSAVPGLNRNIALSEEIKIPPENITVKFDNFCKNIFLKTKNNISQITTLETLRDSLLSKLMSGEVKVR